MCASAGIPSAPGDYSRRAGIYIEVLGWIELLSFNLGGILLIIAGQRVRQHNKAWWWVAVVICGLQAAGMIFAGLAVLFHVPGVRLRFAGRPIDNLERWLLFCVAAVFAGVFILPLLWLLAPATRRSMKINSKGKCVSCGYDIRESKERCPECGFAIPVDRTAEYVRNLEQMS